MRSGCAFHPDPSTYASLILVPDSSRRLLPSAIGPLATLLVSSSIHLTLSYSPFSRPEALRVLRDVRLATTPSCHRTIRIEPLSCTFPYSLYPVIHGSSIRVSTWTSPVRPLSPLRSPSSQSNLVPNYPLRYIPPRERNSRDTSALSCLDDHEPVTLLPGASYRAPSYVSSMNNTALQRTGLQYVSAPTTIANCCMVGPLRSLLQLATTLAFLPCVNRSPTY